MLHPGPGVSAMLFADWWNAGADFVRSLFTKGSVLHPALLGLTCDDRVSDCVKNAKLLLREDQHMQGRGSEGAGPAARQGGFFLSLSVSFSLALSPCLSLALSLSLSRSPVAALEVFLLSRVFAPEGLLDRRDRLHGDRQLEWRLHGPPSHLDASHLHEQILAEQVTLRHTPFQLEFAMDGHAFLRGDVVCLSSEVKYVSEPRSYKS